MKFMYKVGEAITMEDSALILDRPDPERFKQEITGTFEPLLQERRRSEWDGRVGLLARVAALIAIADEAQGSAVLMCRDYREAMSTMQLAGRHFRHFTANKNNIKLTNGRAVLHFLSVQEPERWCGMEFCAAAYTTAAAPHLDVLRQKMRWPGRSECPILFLRTV